jgi:hypothetical protein
MQVSLTIITFKGYVNCGSEILGRPTDMFSVLLAHVDKIQYNVCLLHTPVYYYMRIYSSPFETVARLKNI